jgi:hypothetical protein
MRRCEVSFINIMGNPEATSSIPLVIFFLKQFIEYFPWSWCPIRCNGLGGNFSTGAVGMEAINQYAIAF